jgi:hypothetical protein
VDAAPELTLTKDWIHQRSGRGPWAPKNSSITLQPKRPHHEENKRIKGFPPRLVDPFPGREPPLHETVIRWRGADLNGATTPLRWRSRRWRDDQPKCTHQQNLLPFSYAFEPPWRPPSCLVAPAGCRISPRPNYKKCRRAAAQVAPTRSDRIVSLMCLFTKTTE